MKKAYLVYRTVAGDRPGKESFLYVEKIAGYRFSFTGTIRQAKRFSLFQALLLSLLRLSFVSAELVKSYN